MPNKWKQSLSDPGVIFEYDPRGVWMTVATVAGPHPDREQVAREIVEAHNATLPPTAARLTVAAAQGQLFATRPADSAQEDFRQAALAGQRAPHTEEPGQLDTVDMAAAAAGIAPAERKG